MQKIFTTYLMMLMALPSLRAQQQIPGPVAQRDTGIVITKKWELPAILREVSGITCIGEDRLACVQDERGIVFIYNLVHDSIEKEIPFAGNFDFEGIALAGKTLYAIRSNGILYSIENYNSKKPKVTEIKTWLTTRQNVEGLCYDQAHKRLLVAIKGQDPVAKDYKGIYAYNLRTKQLNKEPVLKINFTDTVWNNSTNKMQPSDLAIHPLTGDIYILDGETPTLLIMSANGIHKKVYYLNTGDFKLPEGITFSKKGRVYICNEGRLFGKGNIVQVLIPGAGNKR